ncbi:MAG TPA: hypothetical protein VFA78_00530 [Chloroflexota bacterium]|nr:hypothetical protein [Chloroflexota bacterium]
MDRLRGQTRGIVLMLVLQFLLGMAVNLFVTITRHHPGANPSEFFSGAFHSVVWAVSGAPILLILHAILGLLLVLTSIGIVIAAFRAASTGIRVLAVLGFLMILGAGFNGASFLNYNHDVNSYLMSVGFAIAIVCYAQILAAT